MCHQHKACVSSAGLDYTGTAINPARALVPAIVFHYHWDKVWLYVIAGLYMRTFVFDNSLAGSRVCVIHRSVRWSIHVRRQSTYSNHQACIKSDHIPVALLLLAAWSGMLVS